MKLRLLALLPLLALSIALPGRTKQTSHGRWQLVWQEEFRGRHLSD